MNYRPIEQAQAETVLRELRGDRAGAAAVLGICRRTLDIKLHSWGIAEQWHRKPGPQKERAA